MLERIAEGRTDLVFESDAAGSTEVLEWCAYYGDVSAIRFLLGRGTPLTALGENLGLNAAAFHGHWRLCEFLIEMGAGVNRALDDTGETPLHAALSNLNHAACDLVVQVLLTAGANPNATTKPGVETGAFMRDCRTKAETALHRAAAFGSEQTIQRLLDSGAVVDAKDMNGDSPLTWASWYLQPDSILRKLLYDGFSIHPERRAMNLSLLGRPK